MATVFTFTLKAPGVAECIKPNNTAETMSDIVVPRLSSTI